MQCWHYKPFHISILSTKVLVLLHAKGLVYQILKMLLGDWSVTSKKLKADVKLHGKAIWFFFPIFKEKWSRHLMCVSVSDMSVITSGEIQQSYVVRKVWKSWATSPTDFSSFMFFVFSKFEKCVLVNYFTANTLHHALRSLKVSVWIRTWLLVKRLPAFTFGSR